jgi:hypothetical protein
MTFHPTWDPELAAEPPTRLTWEIEPAGDGVSRLSTIHGGFEPGSQVHGSVTTGWPLILAGLKTLLETGEPLNAA